MPLAFCVVALACEERPRRSGRSRTAVDEADTGANVFGIDGGLWSIPPDPEPGVTRRPPVDLQSTVCPGMRVVRVDRVRNVADAGEMLAPVFFGRDELGRYVSFEAVLRCELRMMHWLQKPRDEGVNLIVWRGPSIFRHGLDCTWSSSFPAHTELLSDGSRRVTIRERCRRQGASYEHNVTLELSHDYETLTERQP
jgi:hypothetical protein